MSAYIQAMSDFVSTAISDVGGVTQLNAVKTKDATHAIIYVYEDSGAPWADVLECLVWGQYEVEGTRVKGGGYTKAYGAAHQHSFYGNVPGNIGASGTVDVLDGTTAAFPGDYAVFVIPFNEYDRVTLNLQARGGGPEVAMIATALIKEPLTSFPRSTTDLWDAIQAGTMRGLSGPTSQGMNVVVQAEGTDDVDFSIQMQDEFGDAVTGTGMKALVSLVLDGAGLAPATAWTLSENDGAVTTVTPVGTPGLGLYEVEWGAGQSTAQLVIADVATGSAQVINITANLSDVGDSGLNASGLEETGVATFTT